MTEDIRAARKEYTCDDCGGSIRKGERYTHVGVYRGRGRVWKSQEYHFCASCQPIKEDE